MLTFLTINQLTWITKFLFVLEEVPRAEENSREKRVFAATIQDNYPSILFSSKCIEMRLQVCSSFQKIEKFVLH